MAEDQMEWVHALASDFNLQGSVETEDGVTFYFENQEDAKGFLSKCPSESLLSREITTIEPQNWQFAWESQVQPVCLHEPYWVSPPSIWERGQLDSEKKWILINPQFAFGTGHHPSTQLAAKSLVECVSKYSLSEKPSFLEIGVGTGILCFLAALLPIREITGFEIDPGTLENLNQNCKLNHFSNKHKLYIGGIDSLKSTTYYNIILANMIRVRVERVLGKSVKHLSPGGVFIWSGLLQREMSQAQEFAAQYGLTNINSYQSEGWGVIEFQKK